MLLLLFFSFLAGIFTVLSPCILPILPAILTAGVTKGRLYPIGTIVGLISSFSFFTLSLAWLVQVTGLSPSILRYIAIVLIFYFGLILLFPKFSNWFAKATRPIANFGLKIDTKTSQNHGFWGGVVFGAALGLLWTPCAGPILGAIITLVATRSFTIVAVLMTLSYSIGAGVPLLLIAYGSAKFIHASHFLSRHAERIRQIFGIIMLLFALILLLNWDMLLNEKIARIFPELFFEKHLPVQKQLQEVTQEKLLSENTPAPEFIGITGWINSPPLTLKELHGKVVLIDFWTYSCINCIRTLPYRNKWYQDYKQYGFVIIGVHTPEFAFEKNYENVAKAVEHFKIEYPLALDNHYATWNAYHNHYWPAHYLIDQNGMIRLVHFGEGMYGATENAIRNLLGLPPIEIQEPLEISRPTTPETYLGLARGHNYSQKLEEDRVRLRGPWQTSDEYIEAMGNDSYIDLNFLATHVYLVLSGSSPTPLEIILNGKPYGQITIEGDKKYDIVENIPYARYQLTLKIPQGIKAYAFTFGSD